MELRKRKKKRVEPLVVRDVVLNPARMRTVPIYHHEFNHGADEYTTVRGFARIKFPDIWVGRVGDNVYATRIKPKPVEGQDGAYVLIYQWHPICTGEVALKKFMAGEFTPSECFWNTGSSEAWWRDYWT